MTIDLEGITLHPFSVPMRMRFRRTSTRQGVLLQGPAGWGEFSPFPEYSAAYSARWLAAAVEAATKPWPERLRDVIPVNTTVPAVDAGRAHDLVAASGCTTAKVKVAEPGQSLADDVARVEAVRHALGPAGFLRVDANAAWDLDAAEQALRELSKFDLQYAEQPVASLEEMAILRRRVDVPLAVDESVRTAEDPMRVVGLEAADILVLKVQPLGGVARALEIAERAGLPVVVSSALETSVGLAAGLAFAAALPALPYACGLGTAALLADDVVADSLVPMNGEISVRRPPPSQARLAALRPSGDDVAALLERVHAAAASEGNYR